MDSTTTKATLAELQAQVQDLQKGVPKLHQYSHLLTRPTLPTPPPRATLSRVPGPGVDAFPDHTSIVCDAKRNIGFSPIKKVYLDYLKEQHNITDD